MASAAYLMYVQGDLDGSLEWNLRTTELDAGAPYTEVQIAQTLEMMELDQAAEAWYEEALALKAGFQAVQS